MSWRLDPLNTALIIIDFQEKLIPILHESQCVIPKAKKIIEIAKLFSLPIFFTEQLPEKLGPTVPVIREALPNFIQPLTKSEFSAAGCLPIQQLPKNLIIIGCETHVCVRQTAYDLRAKGKNIYLLADALSSRHLLDHQLALNEMQQDKILITTVETVSWELVRQANTDMFRKVLSLLK